MSMPSWGTYAGWMCGGGGGCQGGAALHALCAVSSAAARPGGRCCPPSSGARPAASREACPAAAPRTRRSPSPAGQPAKAPRLCQKPARQRLSGRHGRHLLWAPARVAQRACCITHLLDVASWVGRQHHQHPAGEPVIQHHTLPRPALHAAAVRRDMRGQLRLSPLRAAPTTPEVHHAGHALPCNPSGAPTGNLMPCTQLAWYRRCSFSSSSWPRAYTMPHSPHLLALKSRCSMSKVSG